MERNVVIKVMNEEQAKDFIDEIRFLPEKSITIETSRNNLSTTVIKEKLKENDYLLIRNLLPKKYHHYFKKDNQGIRRVQVVHLSVWRDSEGNPIKPSGDFKEALKQQEEPVVNFEFKASFGILSEDDERTVFNAHTVTRKNPIKLIWLN